MGRAIEDFLREADEIIEKKASAPKPAPSDDEVVKIAHILAAKDSPQFEMTLFEKVAQAAAIIETVQHMDKLEKVAKFEEACREKGYSEEKIAEFLEKRAMNDVGRWAAKHVLPPAVAATAAGIYGHKKGKEKGYKNALDDVQKAFSAQ